MSLRSMIFPPKEVSPAGLLEQQNRQMKAALAAASFIEGFYLLPVPTKGFTGVGRVVLTEGTLYGRDGQYIQFMGSMLWTALSITAQSVRVSLLVNGSTAASLQFSYAQAENPSAVDVATTLPLHAFYRLPRGQTPFKLVVDVGGGGGGGLAVSHFGYYLLRDDPK